MIPAFDSATGMLPCGRYPASMSEAHEALVAAAKTQRRSDVWSHFLQATEVLVGRVTVPVAWIGGSFVTSKPDPDDIDVVYWVEDAELVRASQDPTSARVIEAFMTPGRLKQLGLQVDAYVVPWVSNGTIEPRGPMDLAYYQQRGYWDDFWLRLRSGPKGAQPTRLDSIPRRGYVEVNLDGYE